MTKFTTEDLVEELQEQYPLGVRVLPDGSVAVKVDLVTSRAIMLGCTSLSWERRFCFHDINLCNEWFEKIESKDQVPTGYIARRPQDEAYADPYLRDMYGWK